MAKFTALIAVVAAFLVVPALAAAAPTESAIDKPAGTSFITYDPDQPTSLHVEGTTAGGTGNVDLRCYYGTKAPILASNVSVGNGAFSVDIPVTKTLVSSLGYRPIPFCMMRAVPTGTVPSAPPGQFSPWGGAFIGWGEHNVDHNGAGGAESDYYISRAQFAAHNDYFSIGACGLCDTYLFQSGSKLPSNPIWYGDAALYSAPNGISGRSSVKIDGADAYGANTAYYNNGSLDLGDNPGFPALSETHSVDSLTGNLTVNESGAYAWCADRGTFPPTDASCAHFDDSGVHYERTIRQTDFGQQVTIVDHWKSVDGKPHTLDTFYEDSVRSENAFIVNREAHPNFTWTQDGFKAYADNTQIPVPSSVPATMLVKTDGTTPDLGDTINPQGAMVYGSQPSEIRWVNLPDAAEKNAYWVSRYQRTIPAGGEVSLVFAYTHDYALAPVNAKAATLRTAVAAPSIGIDSPTDGSTVDGGSAHVTGSASSPDGQVTVKVNGVDAPVGADGHWSADVPLSDGANQILAVASNQLGVTTNALASVTRSAPAAAGTVAVPAAAAPIAAAKPVHCVVPKLKGKTLAKAKRLLKQAHCRLGKVVRQASKRVKAGHVLKTRFKAGTRHPAGTRIRVTVARRV